MFEPILKDNEHWEKWVYLYQVYDCYIETLLFESGKDEGEKLYQNFHPLKVTKLSESWGTLYCSEMPRIREKRLLKLADKLLCGITVYTQPLYVSPCAHLELWFCFLEPEDHCHCSTTKNCGQLWIFCGIFFSLYSLSQFLWDFFFYGVFLFCTMNFLYFFFYVVNFNLNRRGGLKLK